MSYSTNVIVNAYATHDRIAEDSAEELLLVDGVLGRNINDSRDGNIQILARVLDVVIALVAGRRHRRRGHGRCRRRVAAGRRAPLEAECLQKVGRAEVDDVARPLGTKLRKKKKKSSSWCIRYGQTYLLVVGPDNRENDRYHKPLCNEDICDVHRGEGERWLADVAQDGPQQEQRRHEDQVQHQLELEADHIIDLHRVCEQA